MPASRRSRRFLETYRVEMARGEWSGHYEATMPSIAAYHRLKIADMLGVGRFALSGRAPVDSHTYGFRPARSEAYFHEAPARFTRKGKLYHPIKAVAQVDGVLVGTGDVTPPAPRPPVARSAKAPGRREFKRPRRAVT